MIGHPAPKTRGVRTSNRDRSWGSKRWLGRTEFLTLKISSEPRLERANHPRERNGALLRVHAEVRSKTCLTPPTLLEMAIYQQLRSISGLYYPFQRRLVEDDETGAPQLDELLRLEGGKQAADGLAAGADHFRDFLVGQDQM